MTKHEFRGQVADYLDDALKERYHAPSEAQFQDEDGEPTIDFLEANDLRTMAERLIRDCPELQHLRDTEEFPLIYLWKRDGGKTGGKATLGKCTEAAGLVKFFSEATWVIWLASNYVNDMDFNKHQVEALLYHELNHAAIEMDDKGNVKPVVVAHDFQGFTKEIERYGAWMGDLEACKDAWQQIPLLRAVE